MQLSRKLNGRRTNPSMNYVDVILPLPLGGYFTYEITQEEAHFIQPGIRVAVSFGKRKIYAALVHSLHQVTPEKYKAKPIDHILDDLPIVTQTQLNHWDWISEYYLCPVGDVMRAALPSAFLLQSETKLKHHKDFDRDTSQLNDEEYLIVEAIERVGEISINEVSDLLNKKTVLPVVHKLVSQSVLEIVASFTDKIKPKTVRFVKLASIYSGEGLHLALDQLSSAPKQRTILMRYFDLSAKGRVSAADLVNRSNSSPAVLKSLVEKGIFEEEMLIVDRLGIKNSHQPKRTVLSPHQESAYQSIQEAFQTNDVCLLHGITSSGKTELYAKQMAETINQGHQVLFLVPEIALSTQLVERLELQFPNQIVLYHSRFNEQERAELWRKIMTNDPSARLIVGARSAIFLPFNDLQLIVVDEEHEQSYKQFDPSPRYHARDAALMLSRLSNAKTILGSATPSIETYYNATVANKFPVVHLNERHNQVLPPVISLVDLKDQYKRKKMNGHFSDILLESMGSALANQQQVILFQNRRGYAPLVTCFTCGHTPHCSQCDVSLTFHQHSNQLRCHYCGFSDKVTSHCVACGSAALDYRGLGTQQVESEVIALFPEIKVGRMDLDTTRGKHAFSKIISDFEQQKIQVLVGTQMVTKGLDFRNVALVGVLNADNLLNYPDFRAHERCFQMLQQVAGRAGRTDKQGQVIIQTFLPEHPVLLQVVEANYQKMFDQQIQQRKTYVYPPFGRVVRVSLKHKNINLVNEAADWLFKSLSLSFGEFTKGPEFPPVARIRNQYQKNILIKLIHPNKTKTAKKIIKRTQSSFESIGHFKSVRLTINVDCY